MTDQRTMVGIMKPQSRHKRHKLEKLTGVVRSATYRQEAVKIFAQLLHPSRSIPASMSAQHAQQRAVIVWQRLCVIRPGTINAAA